MDFEKEVGQEVKITFPENFCNRVVEKLTKAQRKFQSVITITEKIANTTNEIHKNILALHLLAYKFECTHDSKNNKLTRVEIANSFIQIKDVSIIF